MNDNSLGALCSSSGKIEIRERLNNILSKLNVNFTYTVENLNKVLRESLCVILEIIFRHSESALYRKESSKQFFFNLESAIINNIVKL